MGNKPSWYISTVRRLSLYQQHQRRAVLLREELEAAGPKTTAGYSLAPAFTGPSDSVGNLAGKVVDKREELREIELEIRLIEKAVGMLSEEKRLIVDLKYLQENKDLYCQRILRKKHKVSSRDTYYRWKDEAVGELAKMLGEVGE